jgi:hypothetical protein
MDGGKCVKRTRKGIPWTHVGISNTTLHRTLTGPYPRQVYDRGLYTYTHVSLRHQAECRQGTGQGNGSNPGVCRKCLRSSRQCCWNATDSPVNSADGPFPGQYSIVATSSANSTPTSPPSGTPTAASDTSASTAPVRRTPTPVSRSREQPFRLGRPPPLIANPVSVEITAAFTHTLKTLTQHVTWASHCTRQSQALSTLRILSDHFLNTFKHIVHSSLSYNQEYEPDIEDKEGELFWPGAPSTG